MRTVRTTRTTAVLAAFLFLLGACSDPQGTEPAEGAAAADETAGDSSGRGPGGGDGPRGGKGSGGGGAGDGSGGGSANGASTGGSSRARGSGGGSGTRAGDGGATAAYPAAGEYVYDQQGFERFCQGPSCSKEDLPDTQTVTATVQSRSADGVTVVTEARSSESQTMTTTTRYTGAKALITRVEVDFTYGGFAFAQAYDPRPPVEALRFPLEVGQSWRGRWHARTSGDYRIRVVGKSAGPAGHTVYELVTVTNFRGDFSGRAHARVWVDAATRMPVRTDGQIAVASAFGEYSSDFETSLRSGPGY